MLFLFGRKCNLSNKNELLCNIENIKMATQAADFTEMVIDLEVRDLKHLNGIISGLRSKSVVSTVARVHA